MIFIYIYAPIPFADLSAPDERFSYQTASPLFFDLHSEIAAVIAAPQRFCSMPNELRMKTGVADVVAVAKAAAQLRTSVCHAGVMIWTFHHIHTPYTVADLQLL